MNSKKKNFFISQVILLLFILILGLSINYLLYSFFGFKKENVLYISILSISTSLFFYLYLLKSILDPLFKSDDNLQKALKETLHELNIPVSTILLNNRMLEKNIKDEKNLKRLNRINLAANDLLKLYNNMEYKIKKEIDNIENEEFCLQELIFSSLNKFDDIKKDIHIDCNIATCVINCDKNGFEKAIDNLISNAIKYNNENRYIKIQLKDDILSIYNTGNIIQTDNIIKIFDEYYQENNVKNGFGLGLTIVKEFCDKNKIFISIKEDKKGNTFSLNLKNIING
ncbi:MAG: HAMP domain-containing histidine kinase [Campylobacterales bacterium]|nr:HAMP domain-containing histidine kinase [Campylobacterales bacterium]